MFVYTLRDLGQESRGSMNGLFSNYLGTLPMFTRLRTLCIGVRPILAAAQGERVSYFD